MKMSLRGSGDFQLTGVYKSSLITPSVWFNLTEQQQNSKIKKFFDKPPVSQQCSSSITNIIKDNVQKEADNKKKKATESKKK
jgi:hypothetical protein